MRVYFFSRKVYLTFVFQTCKGYTHSIYALPDNMPPNLVHELVVQHAIQAVAYCKHMILQAGGLVSVRPSTRTVMHYVMY
jgi:hypothetical protein